MSAKNITTEKIDGSGFQSGGYKAPGPAGGKHTPKSSVMDNDEFPKRTGLAREKPGPEGGADSQNNKLYKRVGK